ncbi:hypothetical protein GGI07_005596 [Coemansia sp. Benny D115]|nr:hypothetical protein GGI07_005596 [Coemansia sp. Benny D115]
MGAIALVASPVVAAVVLSFTLYSKKFKRARLRRERGHNYASTDEEGWTDNDNSNGQGSKSTGNRKKRLNSCVSLSDYNHDELQRRIGGIGGVANDDETPGLPSEPHPAHVNPRESVATEAMMERFPDIDTENSGVLGSRRQNAASEHDAASVRTTSYVDNGQNDLPGTHEMPQPPMPSAHMNPYMYQPGAYMNPYMPYGQMPYMAPEHMAAYPMMMQPQQGIYPQQHMPAIPGVNPNDYDSIANWTHEHANRRRRSTSRRGRPNADMQPMPHIDMGDDNPRSSLPPPAYEEIATRHS